MKFSTMTSAISSTCSKFAAGTEYYAGVASTKAKLAADDVCSAARASGACVARASRKAGRVAVLTGTVIAEIVVAAVTFALQAVWWLVTLPINIVFGIFFFLYSMYYMASIQKAFQDMGEDVRFANATVVS